MATAKKRVTKKKILPMVPSQLIDLAIKDMRTALKKGWIIDMGGWYNPKAKVSCTVDGDLVVDEYIVCSACAAGAVMALSLANVQQLKKKLEPNYFSANEKQLRAIDDLRQGDARAALDELGLILDEEEERNYAKSTKLNYNIPEFNQQKPEPFFKAMKAFSAKLKRVDY